MASSAAVPATPAAAERILPKGEVVARDPLWFIAPPEQPWQRLAFSSSRWAALEGEELVVRHLPELHVLARLPVPGARNLVTATDAALLVTAADHVYRLAETELRLEPLPRIPRLGPFTVLPHPARGEQLTLAYEGIPGLSTFSLGMPAVAGYAPLVASTELPTFDGRALLGLADGSFVYSCPGGLCREAPAGGVERLELPELGGNVWGLARGEGPDEVWALTRYHAYALHARAPLRVRQRIELPAHAVALASRGKELGVLAVESLQGERMRLRIEIYAAGSENRDVLRFDALGSGPADAGRSAPFFPELAFSPLGDWLAVSVFGPELYDRRRKLRLVPPSAAQKLAPQAP
jgi:hypothetical protein